MRATILGLAIVGGLLSGFLGMKWVSDAAKHRELIKVLDESGLAPEATSQINRTVRAGYLLILGMVASVAAGVVAFKWAGKEKIAGGVLLACAVLPALFATKSLVFTFLLLVAGGLCFALKPKPAPQPGVQFA